MKGSKVTVRHNYIRIEEGLERQVHSLWGSSQSGVIFRCRRKMKKWKVHFHLIQSNKTRDKSLDLDLVEFLLDKVSQPQTLAVYTQSGDGQNATHVCKHHRSHAVNQLGCRIFQTLKLTSGNLFCLCLNMLGKSTIQLLLKADNQTKIQAISTRKCKMQWLNAVKGKERRQHKQLSQQKSRPAG